MRRARDAGLAALALTDHDTTGGVAAAACEGEALGLRVVSGCEFSVAAPWGELHVLGYFLPARHARLEGFLADTRAARERRARLIVTKLQKLGVAIELADVAAQAEGGAVGRPHVARALVECGASADIGEAFARYLGRGRAAFVEKPLPALQQITGLVHEVGGVAVAAHLGEHGTEGQIRRLQEQGLDGLEVRHPSHSPTSEERLIKIAQRLGLAVTGGSDWHGDTAFGDSHATLGSLDVPAAWLDALEHLREQFV